MTRDKCDLIVCTEAEATCRILISSGTMAHSTESKGYRIEESPQVGRQLIANRKILAGEVIIDEPALLTGPGYGGGGATCTSSSARSLAGDHDVCLVCCTNLTSVDKIIKCPNCSLLLCSEFCQNHRQHSENECLVFPKLCRVWEQGRSRTKKSLYNLILTIRGLFYKFRDPSKWDQILMLESKSEALRKADAFHELQDVFNCLSWGMFSFSNSCPLSGHPEINGNEESITQNEDDSIIEAAQHCLGVMRINAFSNFSESYSREGLFFLSSLMSHRCFINTDRQMEIGNAGYRASTLPSLSDCDIISGSKMVVRASMDIEMDKPITTTYLSLLYNTEERHRIMISNWLFMCHCERCQHPTEFNTFVASVRCNCQIDSADTCMEPSFDNVNCDCKINAKSSIIPEIIKARPKTLIETQKLEDWLDQYDNGTWLHPNNSIFTHVKLFLCQYYGRQIGGIDQLSASQLKRKVLYCLQILAIYDKVAPGIQMCRGVISFELWCGLRKLQDLQQLPITIPHTFESQHAIILDEIYLTNVRVEALRVLNYALPNSSEESMANILQQD